MKKIEGLIYPPICVMCGDVIVDNKKGICRGCRVKLSYISEPTCFKCGKEIADDEKEFCEDCERYPKSYERGFPVFNYSEDMQWSIAQYKYKNKREFAEFYGREICKRWGNEIKELQLDAIIPIPISRKRMNQRGFNQAELLAKEIGKRLNITVDSDLILRNHNTLPQKKLDNIERENNLKKAFISSGKIVNYNKVILVDDIYTTGATIEACSKLLRRLNIDAVYYTSICIGKGY